MSGPEGIALSNKMTVKARSQGRPVFFLSAGEASGEHYGALLIEAIRCLAPDASFFGLGGERMAALGFRAVVRAEDVAHMGITEVIRHAPYIYGQYQKLKRSIAVERPDLAILIDFPDVNLRLAEELSRLGVPVVYFVSPQLWAWKKRRILRVQRYVTRMLVIFPFEEPFYRERGVSAEFVGHPLADIAAPTVSRQEFASQHGLDPEKQWIGLLPGSRIKEVRLNLPEMLRAAAMLGPGYQCLLPVAPTLARAAVAAYLPSGSPVHLVSDARATLHHTRASVVASGTATVEAALIGNPFVVVYRLSRLSHAIAKRVVTVPHVAMVNLIAGRRLVPELIQDDFTAANIVKELSPLVESPSQKNPLLQETPQRTRMIEGLTQIRHLLRLGHSDAVQSGTVQSGAAQSDAAHAAGDTAIERVARIALGLLSPAASNLIEPPSLEPKPSQLTR